MLVAVRTPEVVVVGLRVGVVPATACCLALLVTGCSGAESGGSQRGSSSSSLGSTGTAPRGVRADADIGAAVEQWFARSYTRGLRNVRAVLVLVDGRPVLERYRGGLPQDSYDTFSVAKSIVSTLVGIAIEEGKLRGVDVTLGEALSQYRSVMRPEVARTTLRQLLTMTAGLREDPPSGEPLAGTLHGDWVSDILQHGFDHATGTWAYSSIGSHLLAAVLVRATGMPVLEYARARLFDPLGITTRPAAQPRLDGGPAAERAYDAARFAWPIDPQRINTGHAHIKLTATDLAAFGLLMLNKGVWKGRQLLPESWVTEATRAHVDAYGGNRYGYQWWIPDAGDHPAFAAVGFGAQLVEVVPDLRLVVVGVTEPSELEGIDASELEFLVKLAVIPHVHTAA
jgi:CubicO group peptidase (beta-lactamase class C family)